MFSVGREGITTYNPFTFEVTNQWAYEDIVCIKPNEKSQGEFTLKMKRTSKKVDSMKFSTEHRVDLLTEALKFYKRFDDKSFKLKVSFFVNIMPVQLKLKKII